MEHSQGGGGNLIITTIIIIIIIIIIIETSNSFTFTFYLINSFTFLLPFFFIFQKFINAIMNFWSMLIYMRAEKVFMAPPLRKKSGFAATGRDIRLGG